MNTERLTLKCRVCGCRISQADADAGDALVEGMGHETMCEDCARHLAESNDTDKATSKLRWTGPRTYKIAVVVEGSLDEDFDIIETFEAENDAAANRYAEEYCEDVEWYVLDADGNNING